MRVEASGAIATDTSVAGSVLKSVRASIIIATRNRSEQLGQVLRCLANQTLLPAEVIVVDASDGEETKDVIDAVGAEKGLPVCRVRSAVVGSAAQRNMGIERHIGEFAVFLDDDVIFTEEFLENLLAPMLASGGENTGGAAALISNELGGSISPVNQTILRHILGRDPLGNEGRLIGPAFQVPFFSCPSGLTPVDWMSTCGCAYRSNALGDLRFDNHFSGYSFMEDVDLSYRVSRQHQLVVAPAAKLVHLGMGSRSQPDWFRDGKQRILNRCFILRKTMGDRRFASLLRLITFELIYNSATSVKACVNGGSWRRTWKQMAGRLSGAARLVVGRYV